MLSTESSKIHFQSFLNAESLEQLRQIVLHGAIYININMKQSQSQDRKETGEAWEAINSEATFRCRSVMYGFGKTKKETI